MREGRELARATRAFAIERSGRSWWSLLSTIVPIGGAFALLWCDVHWTLRVGASLLLAFLHIRIFVLYHDHRHGAFLPRSRLARWLFRAYGLLALAPESVWGSTHDEHHRTNCRSYGVASVGSYPVLTLEGWRRAERGERIFYRVSRHPLTIALGYLTVFLWGFVLLPLKSSPRRHLDAALSLLLHGALVALLAVFRLDVLLLGVLLPSLFSCAIGSYLFYAQHNFPGVDLRPSAEWDYVHAALRSSSYIRMNPILRWFTANIGYHHIHHLNPRIPFYRLPEAMAALEGLRMPGTTTLWPRDVLRCLRLKLWDPDRERFVSFREARKRLRAERAPALRTAS